jgi:hypothetical protein
MRTIEDEEEDKEEEKEDDTLHETVPFVSLNEDVAECVLREINDSKDKTETKNLCICVLQQ